jgi:transposase-like protein
LSDDDSGAGSAAMARAKATVEFSQLRDLKEQRWGAEEARRVLAAWQRSSLSLNAFAREHGFTAQRLGWWKRRILDGGGDELARFVPVVVQQAVERERVGAAVVLRSPRGTAVEVLDTRAVSPEWLSALVNGLS